MCENREERFVAGRMSTTGKFIGMPCGKTSLLNMSGKEVVLYGISVLMADYGGAIVLHVTEDVFSGFKTFDSFIKAMQSLGNA